VQMLPASINTHKWWTDALKLILTLTINGL
jgi:hypothetical protein